MSQNEFLDYILSGYGEILASIQKVKFYVYEYKGDVLHFAILWVSDNALARDELFEKGPEITLSTGWYPLITGSRIRRKAQAADVYIRESLRKCANRTRFENLFNLGTPISIEKAYDGAGNAILLKTTKWNMLFDTGTDPKKLRLDKLDENKKTIVLLSHAHSDHTGGLIKIIRKKGFFIIATEMTVDVILNRYDHLYGLKNILPRNFFYRFFPARYNCVYNFTSGGNLSLFFSSHYLGSAMILLTFPNGKRLFYTGDFSISPIFGESVKAQLMKSSSRFWRVAENHIDVAVIDAALASQDKPSTSISKEKLMERIDSIVEKNGSVILLTKPQDYGLFLYIDLFTRYLIGSKKRRMPIYVDPILKRQLNTLDKYLKLKWIHAIWPRLGELLRKRVTPCESVWLFEMKDDWPKNFQRHRVTGVPSIFILDYNRVVNHNYENPNALHQLFSNANLICIVGKVANQRKIEGICKNRIIKTWNLNMNISGDVLVVDGLSWMPHCTRKEMEEVVQCFAKKVWNIVFFHSNFDSLEQLGKEIFGKTGIPARGLPDSPIFI